MKLYIITYNDSCGCHADVRHTLIFANSQEEAHKLAPSRALEGQRYWSTDEYPIEAGYVDDI